MSFILVPIDFSYMTSYRLSFSSNFCSRTRRLATIHSVQTDDDRRTQHCSISATDRTKYGRLKMVNGSRHYRALESVSIASALSSALTIYSCQIRVRQRGQSKLQLPTARKKEWWPATADSLPQAVTCQHCDTHYVSRHRTQNLPVVSPTRYQLCYRLTMMINE